MVNKEGLDLIFHALADPTRRAILKNVANGNPTVGELGAPFAMSAPAVSKHLKVLENSGLLTRMKEGQMSRFRLNREPLEHAVATIQVLEPGQSDRSEDASGSTVVEELEDYLL